MGTLHVRTASIRRRASNRHGSSAWQRNKTSSANRLYYWRLHDHGQM